MWRAGRAALLSLLDDGNRAWIVQDQLNAQTVEGVGDGFFDQSAQIRRRVIKKTDDLPG
jgi:hypothetical protein